MSNDVSTQKIKRGYLNEDFLLFNLNDQKKTEFEFHYHDFSKIIIFLSGDVTYIIEGKSYKLRPWDILLVGKNDLHLPIISASTPYKRMILWLNPLFLEKHSQNTCDLLSCFQLASERKLNLIRLSNKELNLIKQNLTDLEAATHDDGFGNIVLKNSLFFQFMVKINRLFLGMEINKNTEDIKYDPRIEDILSYINSNLDKDLSIEMLSEEFYLNKYYLMHLFKKETGYTLYQYIQKKRCIKASDLIKSGISAGDVCSLCGFGDYSSFVRAFKREFQLSPKQYYKYSI